MDALNDIFKVILIIVVAQVIIFTCATILLKTIKRWYSNNRYATNALADLRERSKIYKAQKEVEREQEYLSH